MNEKHILFI
jgi:hypothetical protein